MDDHEAIVLLERARMYAHAWPESTWGRIDYSQLCIISVGRSQVHDEAIRGGCDLHGVWPDM